MERGKVRRRVGEKEKLRGHLGKEEGKEPKRDGRERGKGEELM